MKGKTFDEKRKVVSSVVEDWYETMDTDGNRIIDYWEFDQFNDNLADMGLAEFLTDAETRDLFNSIDINGNGELALDELEKYFIRKVEFSSKIYESF